MNPQTLKTMSEKELARHVLTGHDMPQKLMPEVIKKLANHCDNLSAMIETYEGEIAESIETLKNVLSIIDSDGSPAAMREALRVAINDEIESLTSLL